MEETITTTTSEETTSYEETGVALRPPVKLEKNPDGSWEPADGGPIKASIREGGLGFLSVSGPCMIAFTKIGVFQCNPFYVDNLPRTAPLYPGVAPGSSVGFVIIGGVPPPFRSDVYIITVEN